MDSNSKLLADMIFSQSLYVAARIDSKQNREIYLDTIKNIETIINTDKTYAQNRQTLYWYATEEKDTKINWDFWGNKRKYRNLALDQTQEIMDSIGTRFINGGSKAYDIW